jgi:hypothetical protein
LPPLGPRLKSLGFTACVSPTVALAVIAAASPAPLDEPALKAQLAASFSAGDAQTVCAR